MLEGAVFSGIGEIALAALELLCAAVAERYSAPTQTSVTEPTSGAVPSVLVQVVVLVASGGNDTRLVSFGVSPINVPSENA